MLHALAATRTYTLDTADRLFSDVSTSASLAAAERGAFDTAAWTKIVEAGLTFALTPEEAGGFGLPIVEGLEIARSVGEHLLPLPLCETMLAAWALGTHGLAIPDGPLTVAAASIKDPLCLARDGDGWRLTGTARRIPWAEQATAIAVLAEADDGARLTRVERAQLTTQAGQNLAMEPRAAISFDMRVPAKCVAAPGALTALSFRAAGAVMRCLQMAGALTRLTDMTATYAQDRVQFGKSLSKFQAIQHNIAILATQSAAASSCASLAAEAFAGGMKIDAIAAAKARIGEAAGIAAPIAHQIHGAMGFTYEHQLHFVTKRLLSWREEFGNEREWQQFLGARVRQQGADGAWSYLSAI